jgi:hypothetical protein
MNRRYLTSLCRLEAPDLCIMLAAMFAFATLILKVVEVARSK